MKAISQVALMALLGLTDKVNADIPAKCLRADMYGGTWHFYVS